MQAKTLFQLGMKFVAQQRDHALGVAVAFGPYDRHAVARQRQDRERSGGQEMLLGAAEHTLD